MASGSEHRLSLSQAIATVRLVFFERNCTVCRAPADVVCDPCRRRLRSQRWERLDQVRSAVVLDAAARDIVVALKYRRERRVARWVAQMMRPLVPVAAEALTWAPATPERTVRRGYDQAHEIALQLAKLTGVPVRRLLRRDRRDQRQTGRSRSERQVGPALVGVDRCDGLVVVVDDIVTTGATLARAADKLTAAGADRVIRCAFAATPLHSPPP